MIFWEVFVNLIRAMLTASGLVAVTLSAQAATATLVCQGGGMPITKIDTGWIVNFERASEASDVAPPGRGECAMPEMALPDGSATTLTVPSVKGALLLLAAAKGGGTFEVQVTGENGSLVVKQIGPVNVVDSDPLSPEDGDDADDDGEMAGGDCGEPGDRATVVIPEPNLKKLNVRAKPHPKAKIIGTVNEGKKVTLDGLCESDDAAGLVAENNEDENGWCRISKPLAGCVVAKYLQIDGGGILDDAAGIAKKN